MDLGQVPTVASAPAGARDAVLSRPFSKGPIPQPSLPTDEVGEGRVSDASSTTPTQANNTDALGRVLVSGIRTLVWLGAIWLILFSIHWLLPYIRPGHEIVYQTKIDHIRNDLAFPPSAKHRVVIFGNSKVLAGFIPELFDSLSNNDTCSYNLGLPDATHFLDELRRLVARGQVPTHVLLTTSWDPAAQPPGLTVPVDEELMAALFPFRHLPRDATLFLIRSASRGGPVAYYRCGRQLVDRMLRDRGYFFIEGQSHFPNHRLPEGFRLATDRPDRPWIRNIELQSHVFRELLELGLTHDIQFWLVPTYYREGQYAPPPRRNEALTTVLGPYSCFRVVGSDYLLLANKYFSDPVHLNRKGACVCTARLHELCRKLLTEPASPAAGVDSGVATTARQTRGATTKRTH